MVRVNLARRMTAELEPEARIVDDTDFPKEGPLVDGRGAAQNPGTLGRTLDCQIVVSIPAATDQALCSLDWRIYLPAEWDELVRVSLAHAC